ncbi:MULTISPECIES: hypothetical protein [Sphingomonas]|uniref:hypothetical protein n=1 Tax=Sphingomonas TaxID=13687 RepID=UPI0012EEA0BC|nr:MULTISPECIES: hypothetical protein [Sphingomonas]
MTFFTWPFDPTNDAAVAGVSYWLTIVGFALTIFGLGLTWRQLIKTQTATAAVEDELRRVQLAIATYDAAHEIAKAIAALDATRRHLRNRAWRDVADGYEVFRRSILTTASLFTFDQETLENVELANKYISRLCERIEDGVQNKSLDVDPAKTITMIRQHDELAGRINIILQKGTVA